MSEMKFDHHTLVRVLENFMTVSVSNDGSSVMKYAGGDPEKTGRALLDMCERDDRIAEVMDAYLKARGKDKPKDVKWWTWGRVGLAILLIIFAVFAAIGIRESYLRDGLINHSQIPPYSVRDTAAKE